ncbi:unnamed protein product [Diatraea saccharalis]|uniref:Multiple inositol polyphosphate phosphatase 1 n=1 Tax=Diatraea saccharalis TaxID=40085 RepID=A0A9N9QV44_9NEOP|nr:unnamed protein product [Diatraea saccharalis]
MNIHLINIIAIMFYHALEITAINNNDVRNHLGTRTPYRFRYNKNDSRIKYPGCRDARIWMIIRHGTRLPSAKDIVGMKDILRDLKYEILFNHKKSKEQLKRLEEWSSDIDIEEEKYLTREGQDEMIFLAERMQKRFPNAIKSKYDNKTFYVLEYYHDLKHYWMDSYGHNLTYKQACMAIKTMFEDFKKKSEPHATFLFAHSGTLLKILTHMQLYKPSAPLTGHTIDKKRKWKTSDIDCFASNLAFVLYKCEDGNKVLTLHQENIIRLPMCEHDLCPLEHLEKHFHESIYNCDFTDMCSLNNTIA